jgi:hypothetical protein
MNIKNKISNAKLFEEMKEFASTQEFQSLDELNAKLSELVQEKNNSSVSNFLGLSPHQMHLVLYKPFSLTNDIFCFTSDDNNQLKEIPVIKQAMFFMNKLNDAGELKGTQLGNLPKNFVVEFYQLFLSNERFARMPSKEDDLYQLTRLKHLLDLAGLIKKQNKKFSLTKKGQLILSNENYIELFKEIILAWVNRFNDNRSN